METLREDFTSPWGLLRKSFRATHEFERVFEGKEELNKGYEISVGHGGEFRRAGTWEMESKRDK